MPTANRSAQTDSPRLIADEARVLHGLERSPERDAELAREATRLNDAVREAARELEFDDQPTDFLAQLVLLREAGETAVARNGSDEAPGRSPRRTAPRDDVSSWSLAQAAGALRTHRISSVELTRACLARAEAANPQLNCFLAIEADSALAAAQRADDALACGDACGLLHGVPLAHKDMFYRAGKVTTGGTKIRRDFVPHKDSTIAKRLDAAGAVWLGALNMSEFAANPAGHNVHYGHCRNPWDPESITGGSSSGSAAAVGARACFGSIGSDTGGSIRVPAAVCGVVGLKPTYGLVSRHGALPRSWSLDCVGPLARTVEDCALLTQAIAGRDPLDPTSADLPVPDYVAGLRGGIEKLRIGVPANFFFDDVHPSVHTQLDSALQVLQRLGAECVKVVVPDQERLFTISDAVVKSEAATLHGRWIRERPQDYSLFVRSRIEAGFHIPATRYLEAVALRARILADFVARAFEHADVLFTPVLPIEVPKLAATEVGTPADVQRVIVALTRCTRNVNFLGLPALCVPCGFSSNGMPVGFQLIGRPFSEATLFRTGHAYESATDWHLRLPAGIAA
jgi:aspartyl-tRNA(Asn)/glutamyl-tRNA(Gln) amidotransferase subunit A